MSKKMSVIFFLGIAVTALGLFVALSNKTLFNFAFLTSLSEINPILPKHFNFYQNVLIGLSIALIGAILSGLAARKVLPDIIGRPLLPASKFSMDKFAIGALALAVLFHGLLYWHLFRKQYTHWDVLLFLGGLFLIGLAMYRFDLPKNKSVWNFTRLDAVAILGLIIFCVLINSVNITHWSFYGVGDEHGFFAEAARIVQGQPWNFFKLDVVFQAYSWLESAYQALFLKIFGINIVSWRLSEVFVQAVTAALLYIIGKLMIGRLAGFAAGIAMASSHYVMAFNTIGYNNTHTFVYATLVILMLFLAWRTQRALFTYLIGVAMAFCLWTTWMTLLIWVITAFVLLVNFFQKPAKSQIFAAMLIVFGLIVTAVPALIVTPSYAFSYNLIKNTPFDAAEDSSLSLNIYRPDLFYLSFTSFWVNDHSFDHYVYGSFVDHISGILLLIGLSVCLFRFKNYGDKMFFLWFVLGILLVQLSNDTNHLKITRLLFVLPAAAMLIGVAVSTIYAVMRRNLKISKVIAGGVVIVILLSIPVLNLYQLRVQGYNQRGLGHHGIGLKVLHDYPDRTVIKVDTEATKHDFWFIQILIPHLYPWYSGHYGYVNLTDVSEDLPMSYLNLSYGSQTLPASFVNAIYYSGENIAENLSEKLPSYKVVKDCEPRGWCLAVFLPPDYESI